MERRIAIYELKVPRLGELRDDLREWRPTAAKLRGKFSGNFTKGGTPVFEAGSNADNEFSKYCSELGIKAVRKEYWESNGQDLYRHPYFYLAVATDKRFSRRGYEFMDYTDACPGGGDIRWCRVGQRQIQKVRVEEKLAALVEQLHVVKMENAPIYIVSRRLKEMIQSSAPNGCRFVPCLDPGRKYAEESVQLEARDERIEDEARYFQLVVTQQTVGPAQVGPVRIVSQCHGCHSVYLYEADRAEHFHPKDVSETDFQSFVERSSENVGLFKSPWAVVIISVRLLRLLIENRIKGLVPFWTEPLMRYRVVEIG